VLRDDKGRLTGFVGGKIVNNIPGVVVQRTIASQNWRGAPEPTYLVPKATAVSATIDGSALEKPDKETITLIGQGLYAEVDDIVVEPDSKNVIDFEGGENGIMFHTDPRHDQTPILSAVIQEGKTFYDFSATALGVKGGSVLTAYFEKESGAFGLLTEGSTVTTNAQYVLVGIRSRPQGEDTWSTSNLKIPQGEIALVLYREIGGRNELVQVFTASGDGKKITSAGQKLQPDND
jgi:hypothetical protein